MTAAQQTCDQDIAVEQNRHEDRGCDRSPEKPGSRRRIHQCEYKGCDIHAGKEQSAGQSKNTF